MRRDLATQCKDLRQLLVALLRSSFEADTPLAHSVQGLDKRVARRESLALELSIDPFEEELDERFAARQPMQLFGVGICHVDCDLAQALASRDGGLLIPIRLRQVAACRRILSLYIPAPCPLAYRSMVQPASSQAPQLPRSAWMPSPFP
jgi:hypothetical protein